MQVLHVAIYRTILSVLYTMVEIMRCESENDTEEQIKNRQTFAEELGVYDSGSLVLALPQRGVMQPSNCTVNQIFFCP